MTEDAPDSRDAAVGVSAALVVAQSAPATRGSGRKAEQMNSVAAQELTKIANCRHSQNSDCAPLRKTLPPTASTITTPNKIAAAFSVPNAPRSFGGDDSAMN